MERTIDSKFVAPYICPLSQDFEARVAAGWAFQEFHQVFVRDDGRLEVTTDIEQPLRFWCTATPPGGAGNFGSGVGTVSDAPPLCQNDDRRNTEVRLFGVLAGTAIDVPPTTCLILLQSEGELQLQFGFPRNRDRLDVVLKHCLAQGEKYPTSLSLPSPGCTFTGVLGLFDSALGKSRVNATQGAWVIDEATLGERGGRARGSIDLVFEDGSSRVTLTGTYDLPVVRAF
jgi:hypothetical protein